MSFFIIFISVLGCSLLGTTGEYSGYDVEQINRFVSANIKAPDYRSKSNDGEVFPITEKEKELFGSISKVTYFYVHNTSNAVIVMEVISFPTVKATQRFIDFQAERGYERRSGEESGDGKPVIYVDKNWDKSVMVVDCRGGLCLKVKNEVEQKDKEAALKFYREISKNRIWPDK